MQAPLHMMPSPAHRHAPPGLLQGTIAPAEAMMTRQKPDFMAGKYSHSRRKVIFICLLCPGSRCQPNMWHRLAKRRHQMPDSAGHFHLAETGHLQKARKKINAAA
jgi:hypothetical protein